MTEFHFLDTMDNIDLQIKKLHGHWTAHHFTVSITSKADVDNIRSRFEKCDKKSKVVTVAEDLL